jgi:DNA-binding HxlR family transcriptional regulator
MRRPRPGLRCHGFRMMNRPRRPAMKTAKDYRQPEDYLRDNCPVKAAIDVIRGRWKPSILCELNAGTKRFSDLQCALPEIAPQVLTVQLRQLEADGVIARTVHPEVPPRVEYALTPMGRDLSRVMEELEAWGNRYLESRGRNPAATAACGASLYCE